MIEILSTGAPNTVQDRGRPGYLASGVSRGGAMDRLALDLGNALLGNDADAAGLEIALFPFRLRFGHDTRFALTGADCRATLDGRPLPPVWTRQASAGQVLALGPPQRGARAYVTVAGGIAVPRVLGSRSTDLKGGFGGLDGRGFKRGDRLDVDTAAGSGPDSVGFGAALPAEAGDERDAVPVRVIPAAEYDAFDPTSRAAFTDGAWEVSREANRLGYRLTGPALAREQPRELLSHGIVPGVIQVPANGQPIIQLADANTCGGYPKIAAVIDADLWRIAQAPIGSHLRFVLTDTEAAVDVLRRQAAWLAAVRATAAHLRRRG